MNVMCCCFFFLFFFSEVFWGMKEAVAKKNKQDYIIDKISPSTCDNYASGNRD